MSPNFASRSQVFTVPKVGAGGGGGSSPSGVGDPAFAGRSRIFNVQGKGGGGGSSPTGVGDPTFAGRSQVHMVLPSGGCICGITDTFTRTVADGWGTSDAGLIWSLLSGDGVLSVDGGIGHIIFDATHDSAQPQIVGSFPNPIDLLFKGSMETVEPDGGWSFTIGDGDSRLNDSGFDYIGFSVEMSDNVNQYGMDAGQLWLYSNIGHGGHFQDVVVTLPSGFELTGGEAAFTNEHFFWVRWTIARNENGTITHSARAWWDGDAEPSSDEVTYTSTSTVMCLMNYLAGLFYSYNWLPDSQYAIDSLDISSVNRCTEYRFDNFRRTEAAGWGTSDYGLPWTKPYGDGGTTNWVSNDHGYVECPSANGLAFRVTDISGPWTKPGGFVFTAFFRLDTVPAGSNTMDIGFYSLSGGISLEISSGVGKVILGSDEVAKTDWEVDISYLVKWEFIPDTVSRLKIWKACDVEPESWLITESPITSDMGDSWDVTVDSHASGIITAYFDYIDFDYDGKPCYLDELGNPVYP